MIFGHTSPTLALGVLLLLLASSSTLVLGNLELSVTADDRRVIDLGSFGFASGGVFKLRVEHFFLDDPTAFGPEGRLVHNESMGFVLQIVQSALSARIEPRYEMNPDGSRPCFIDMKIDAKKRFIFQLNGEQMANLTQPDRFFSATIVEPGLYALFFYNCKGFRDKSKRGAIDPIAASFTAQAEEYNVASNGDRNYLSLGDQPLPVIYTAFFLLFAAITVVWTRQMRQNATYVTRMHRVMLFLVAVKCLSLLFEAAKFAHYRATGQASVWDIFYYVFLTAKGMTLFAVLILLGSGWSILKPFLSENDKKLLLVLVPCQVVVNIFIAVLEETNEGTRNYNNWMDLLRLLDVLCCCGVLLPVVWSIKNLRDAAELDEKAALSLSRMRQFRTFYILVVAYIYFTRIILVMVEGTLDFDLLWIAKFLREMTSLLFYTYTGFKFRPMKENPYLNLNQDDLDEIKARTEIHNNPNAREREMQELGHPAERGSPV